MDPKIQALLQAMLLAILGDYVETMKFVLQKQIISSRSPQPWMVDKAYNTLFNNVPQFASQAANPVPVQSGNSMADILALLQSGQPIQPPTQASGSSPTP